jgi:hypothetical protein
MPKTDRIRAVLDDLYTLDPSLRAQEKELEQAVAALLAAKPDVTVDKQFVRSLRSRLTPSARSSSSTQSTSMNKPTLMFLLPTAAIATIAVVAAVTVSQLAPSMHPQSGSQPTPVSSLAYGVTISRASANAFGDLSGLTGGEGTAGSSMFGRGGGGGGGPSAMTSNAVAPQTPSPTAMGSEKMVSNDAMIARPIMPPNDNGDYTYDRPRYVYDGELPALEANVSVYRRQSHPVSGSGLLGALQGVSFNGLNLNSFGDAAVQQFTLVQSGQFGYQIYVDLQSGSISINQNYTSWPHPEMNCGNDQNCYERLQLKATDVPDDAALTQIADSFLNDHGISKASFGTPVVDRRWGRVYPMAASADAANAQVMPTYVPDNVTVTYPLLIDGMTAYDQSGYPYGLSVGVDIRNKRVSNVWNLQSLDYQASSYEAITDAKQILDIASRGDLYAMPFGQDSHEKAHDVKLGAPEKVLMQTWHTAKDGTGEELLVPALRFPVSSENPYDTYREAVMVPLVKDLLTPPVIMYMKGGVGMGGATTMVAPAAEATTPVNTPTPATPPVAVDPKR